MRKLPLCVLRIGLAITFIWIGIFIFRDPEAWGGYLQPWAVALLPTSIKDVMIGNALLDMTIGIGFLINSFLWLAALLGALHLIIVLAVSGVNEATVRDIGLLGAALYLVFETAPDKYKFWIRK